MAAIYLLIPLSLVLLIVALGAFYWALHNDQFDDLESPALDILNDEDLPSTAEKSEGDSA